jgi:hypothetical protein
MRLEYGIRVLTATRDQNEFMLPNITNATCTLASKDDVEIFESVAHAVTGAQEILVIGHGKGKANHMVKMVQHWERKFPATAKLVVGAIDSDLPRLTEPEILASARAWFDHFHEFGF